MPRRSHRTKRTRSRLRSELDWFAEDPWADPGTASDEDPDEPGDEEGVWLADEDDGWLIDDDDSWGPIRPRR